jgi:cytochrome c oxidase cbb3-type subunit 1
VALALLGLTMAAAARHGDPMAVHGFMALALGLSLVFASGRRALGTAPPGRRGDSAMMTTRPASASWMTLIWAVIAMAVRRVGRRAALLARGNAALAMDQLRPAAPGAYDRRHLRLWRQCADRDVFHVCSAPRARGWRMQLSPWVVLIGYNLFCVWAVTGLSDGRHPVQGICRGGMVCRSLAGRRLAGLFRLYLRTLARRAEPHIYVANWYYLAFILVVAMLHIVNNLALPVSLDGAKSYTIWSGVQDAMVQWWYGHNAVAFFLTAGFLGMLYYFLPVRSGRPIWSYRLSILSASGASPSSTSGSARTICITPRCPTGCRLWE